MARTLMLYSTTDGHTLEICRRLQRLMEAAGDRVELLPIEGGAPPDPADFDKIVIGASIRYGKHSRAVVDFIKRHVGTLEARPSAFFSVNLVARKPDKNQPGTNPYLKRFLKRIPWQPKNLAVFAGKLDYPRYDFFDRWMIRLIMWITKGPTDPTAVVEFTDWARVDAFARELAALRPTDTRA